MAQASNGDKVKVHYTGKLDDGTVFDSSAEREPLEFTIGEDEVILGFEQAVVGMEPGESKSSTVSAEEAYGAHQEDMVLTVNRKQIPEHVNLEVGKQLQIRESGGQPIVVRITEFTEADVTLDANHPLAGEDLTFDIELVEIV